MSLKSLLLRHFVVLSECIARNVNGHPVYPTMHHEKYGAADGHERKMAHVRHDLQSNHF